MKDLKISYSEKHIYRKTKVKIKREILTTRMSSKYISKSDVGKYVKPEEWNDFINNKDVVLIDTRNNYEVEVGTFNEALNPNCTNFTDILTWLKKNIVGNINYNKKKIAMFCTGGIRCEKATSFIKKLGHQEVYHLEGGILKYLEKETQPSLWKGECFVFDNRVTINSKLKIGNYSLCYACRMPLSEKDKKSKYYKEGISCLKCYGKKSLKQINKYKSRQLQLTNLNNNNENS